MENLRKYQLPSFHSEILCILKIIFLLFDKQFDIIPNYPYQSIQF
jgi:hypothetical protein